MVFGEFSWAIAGFVGTALAPTDAALSVQVINDERVPLRLRRAQRRVGSTMGSSRPLSASRWRSQPASLESPPSSRAAGTAIRELGLGIVAGIVVGFVGAVLINATSRRNWIAPGGRRLATLATAIGAFAVAIALDANGFIAAFVAGMAFGATLDEDVVEVEQAIQLSELGGELLALVVWFFFGAALVPIAFSYLDAAVIGYALLSLTLTRMLPVVLAMLRSGLGRTDVVFLAWFGPRGLASVVFALLALEELGPSSDIVGRAVAVVALQCSSALSCMGSRQVLPVVASSRPKRSKRADRPDLGRGRAASFRLTTPEPKFRLSEARQTKLGF